ncbi:hypothetical protein [Sphingomicrobium sediminis]|uniref:Uncharacterized protein n=1 Tax=Sphingomicrobium sediminis TaxID=2950949 RepID=A0A9X2EGG8_9SPHN|nr:hypothetical protein [Sphingomicrobium sediminis]MCM8557578.1 hypothetical protein [Sphingomicrobium sediminis]
MGVMPQQRIRIGITGLAVVFLLVLLGTAVTGAREDVPVENEDVFAEDVPPPPANEPLSELGVAPGQAAEQPAPAPIPIPIDPATEELIVNEITVPPEGE